jgi:hypothetical protein
MSLGPYRALCVDLSGIYVIWRTCSSGGLEAPGGNVRVGLSSVVSRLNRGLGESEKIVSGGPTSGKIRVLTSRRT